MDRKKEILEQGNKNVKESLARAFSHRSRYECIETSASLSFLCSESMDTTRPSEITDFICAGLTAELSKCYIESVEQIHVNLADLTVQLWKIIYSYLLPV